MNLHTLTIFFIVTIFLSGCDLILDNKQNSEQFDNKEEFEQLEPISDVDRSNWNHYTNETFSFDIYYPPELTFFEYDASLFFYPAEWVNVSESMKKNFDYGNPTLTYGLREKPNFSFHTTEQLRPDLRYERANRGKLVSHIFIKALDDYYVIIGCLESSDASVHYSSTTSLGHLIGLSAFDLCASMIDTFRIIQ